MYTQCAFQKGIWDMAENKKREKNIAKNFVQISCPFFLFYVNL